MYGSFSGVVDAKAPSISINFTSKMTVILALSPLWDVLTFQLLHQRHQWIVESVGANFKVFFLFFNFLVLINNQTNNFIILRRVIPFPKNLYCSESNMERCQSFVNRPLSCATETSMIYNNFFAIMNPNDDVAPGGGGVRKEVTAQLIDRMGEDDPLVTFAQAFDRYVVGEPFDPEVKERNRQSRKRGVVDGHGLKPEATGLDGRTRYPNHMRSVDSGLFFSD